MTRSYVLGQVYRIADARVLVGVYDAHGFLGLDKSSDDGALCSRPMGVVPIAVALGIGLPDGVALADRYRISLFLRECEATRCRAEVDALCVLFRASRELATLPGCGADLRALGHACVELSWWAQRLGDDVAHDRVWRLWREIENVGDLADPVWRSRFKFEPRDFLNASTQFDEMERRTKTIRHALSGASGRGP